MKIGYQKNKENIVDAKRLRSLLTGKILLKNINVGKYLLLVN